MRFISIHALLAESDISSGVSPPVELYFYPRSPCGERRCAILGVRRTVPISIHALLAESDGITYDGATHGIYISIHALLAESDVVCNNRFSLR